MAQDHAFRPSTRRQRTHPIQKQTHAHKLGLTYPLKII